MSCHVMSFPPLSLGFHCGNDGFLNQLRVAEHVDVLWFAELDFP